MNRTDIRTQSAIDAALDHITQAATAAVDTTAKLLDSLVSEAETKHVPDREILSTAQRDLRNQLPTFNRLFSDGLRDKVMQEFLPNFQPQRRDLASTNWESLSLVEDSTVEEHLFSDRIGQGISYACEWELRELAGYTGALLPAGRVDKDPNPFRPEVVGAVLYSAIEAVSPEHESRKLLARELGSAVAKTMRTCYGEIVQELKSRGVQPLHMSALRATDATGHSSPPSQPAQGRFSISGKGALDTGNSRHSTHGGQISSGSGGGHAGPERSRGSAPKWISRPYGNGVSDGGYLPQGSAPMADAELMSVIRRLASVPSGAGEFGEAVVTVSGASSSAGWAADSGDLRGDGATGMMAVNLIRAHRDELRQASNGTIEHMVIDVVASLFDQILSDSRVSPQMARQIARLQLPVLRVALSDSSFFSTRKHPVRRFVNRLASLACSYDEFDDGPGQQFLARVSELVQEIVDGDFDQVDVYADKLSVLEAFVQEQSVSNIESKGADALLDGKESELQVQQRYMHQLRTALAPLSVPEYLSGFLSQVWSQAIVLVIRRDGPGAERVQRMKRAARELVLSVQPKDTPALRKAFLTTLPRLMKDLNEGLNLIGWPEAAQKDFFGRLLPAHAESLRGKGQSELERNLLAKQLDAVFNVPIPSAAQLATNDVSTQLDGANIERQFSAEEVQRIGLVDEASVNWDQQVDIDLGVESQEQAELAQTPAEQLDLGQGLNLNTNPTELAEPSHGLELINHMQVGFAYQMHLKDAWQKVRLSYISKGRGFFVFTHGPKHQQTISLTSRMLSRMCETGRLRTFESNHLLERAIARARKQLSAIKTSGSTH